MSHIKKIMFLAALASHLSGFYIVGGTRDEWLSCNEANFSSILFVLATTLLLAEQNIQPTTKYPLPSGFLYTYYVLSSIFINSLALRLIWLPIMDSLNEVNSSISSLIRSAGATPIFMLADILKLDQTLNVEVILLAATYFGVMFVCTGAFEILKETLQRSIVKKPNSKDTIIVEDSACTDEEDSSEDMVFEETSSRRKRRAKEE